MLGYNTSWDGWDIYLAYTQFNYKKTNAYDLSYYPYVNMTGNMTYKINFNLGDLDLGRRFKISKKLKFRQSI
jgi:hypothetical protein